MAKKIYRAICLVAVLVLLVSLSVLTAVLYGSFSLRTQRELQVETVYLAHGLEQQGEDYLRTLQDKTRRITLIAADGTVRYDNYAEAGTMGSHLDREEVLEAMQTGVGVGSRVSQTLAEDTFYYAMRLSDGSVLRMAATQRSVWGMLLELLPASALVTAGAILLAALLARRVSEGIVAPINALDLEHPEQNEPYEEISALLGNIVRLRRTIDRQLEQAHRKQEEFNLITGHMSEGLLVLDADGRVLSCNGAAARLLGAGPIEAHAPALSLNRSEPFRQIVEQVLSGVHAEQQLKTGEQTLELMGNPVKQNGGVTGAVLLVVDVTERAQREQLRREFSANVSHELKTPLTSISGFAELLRSGLVAPEHVAEFSADIYDEAQRLIRLVEDIIRLSALDEEQLHRELTPVDLFALAREQLKRLEPAAEKAQIRLSLLGGPAVVRGEGSVLTEMVYNLCDNAIKYNRPGGLVEVTVTDGEWVSVSVRDTGIGIPAECRSRVFERFYRVDKSHSRSIGGTGLGLSIVKHGAAFHNGRVELESKEGEGTAVTLFLPKT